VRADLVAVVDRRAQSGPELADDAALRAHGDGGFDAIGVHRVDRVRHGRGRIVEGAGDDGSRAIEKARDAVVSYRRARLAGAKVHARDPEALERAPRKYSDRRVLEIQRGRLGRREKENSRP
jgi:hypothetical protein